MRHICRHDQSLIFFFLISANTPGNPSANPPNPGTTRNEHLNSHQQQLGDRLYPKVCITTYNRNYDKLTFLSPSCIGLQSTSHFRWSNHGHATRTDTGPTIAPTGFGRFAAQQSRERRRDDPGAFTLATRDGVRSVTRLVLLVLPLLDVHFCGVENYF